MKKCNECKIEKPLNEFFKRKISIDGVQHKCKECRKIIDKKYNKKYRGEIKEYNKQYNKENKDKIRKQQKQYYLKTKAKRKEYRKQYDKENPHYIRWRSILHRTLEYLNQDKTSPTEETLGYSAIELKQHLDNLGMNWETHHIDHIIPLSWFKKDTPIHLVNDLRNLQPLLEHENKAKSNKFTLQNNQEYISEVKQWIKNNKLKNLK
jgi:hypothetical protein